MQTLLRLLWHNIFTEEALDLIVSVLSRALIVLVLSRALIVLQADFGRVCIVTNERLYSRNLAICLAWVFAEFASLHALGQSFPIWPVWLNASFFQPIYPLYSESDK